MLWCKKVGTEPYLALNMGTGTLEEGKHKSIMRFSLAHTDIFWSSCVG